MFFGRYKLPPLLTSFLGRVLLPDAFLAGAAHWQKIYICLAQHHYVYMCLTEAVYIRVYIHILIGPHTYTNKGMEGMVVMFFLCFYDDDSRCQVCNDSWWFS